MITAIALLLALAAPTPGTEPTGTIVRPQDISARLAKAKLELTRPAGFRPTFVRPNHAMEYDLALKSPDDALEVRYAVRVRAVEPEAPQPTPSASAAPRPRRVVVSDASLFPALAQATVLNISGGEMPEIRRLDPRALGDELGADEGLTAVFRPKAAGWAEHAMCMMLALKKAGASEAYVFFLFDDSARAEKQIDAAFYSLRFAGAPPGKQSATPGAQ